MNPKALVVLVMVLSYSLCSSGNPANSSWTQTYITKHARDVEADLIPDKGNGFLYLCGEVFGPRLKDASFAGMIYNNAMEAANSPSPSVEQNFTDGTVTKLDISSGKVLQSYRETGSSSDSHVHTTFSAMKLSPSTKYLFAIGNMRHFNLTAATGVTAVKDWTIIRIFRAHSNEDPFADYTILTQDGALSSTPVVDATEDMLILCSTIIATDGMSFSVITKLTPPFYSGAPSWQSWRVRLTGSSCTTLSIGSDGERVFVGGGLDGGVGVWQLSTKTGYVFWSRKLNTSNETTTVNGPVAIGERNGCVYALVQVKSVTNITTTGVFKLSANYGTIIRYSETCCAQLNDSHAAPIFHTLLLQRDSIKHVARTEQTLLVAGVSTHGEVEPLKRISGLTVSDIQRTRAVKLGLGRGGHEAFVLSETWLNGQTHTKMVRVPVEQGDAETGSTGAAGEDDIEQVELTAMVRLSVRVDVMYGAGTCLAAVCDMTAEAVGGDMDSAIVSGKEGLQGDREGYGEFVVNVRGKDVGSAVVMIHRVMREEFQRRGIERSKIEAQLNVKENCVLLVNFSVQTVTQSGIEQQRAAHGRSEETRQDMLKGTAQNGTTSLWVAIGFMAVGVATVAIVSLAVVSARRMAGTEVNDVEESFDGKPVRGRYDS